MDFFRDSMAPASFPSFHRISARLTRASTCPGLIQIVLAYIFFACALSPLNRHTSPWLKYATSRFGASSEAFLNRVRALSYSPLISKNNPRLLLAANDVGFAFKVASHMESGSRHSHVWRTEATPNTATHK